METKIRGLKPIEGENAGVDRIGFGEKAEMPGEMANACAAGLVHGDAKLRADRKTMPLVAAGRFADSQQGGQARARRRAAFRPAALCGPLSA